MKTNTCKDCGKIISRRAIYCRSCASLGSNNPMYRDATTCPKCGGKKKNSSLLCRKCSIKILKGENHPNWRGKVNSICPNCGNTKEWHAKVCRKCWNQFGENNPNWRNGIKKKLKNICGSRDYRIFGYTDWRKDIFERDNWICQHCSKKNKNLVAHHIQNFTDYPELRIDLNNGITLCKRCHKRFHSLFGIKNNSLGQLKWFLKNVKI